MKNCDRRRQSVLNMLRKTKKLTVEEAMQAFGVSESTVRRLFAQLEAEGEVIRAYGGICFTGRSDVHAAICSILFSLKTPMKKTP